MQMRDCRTDEIYNQKNLNKKNKEFLAGFDWCTEQAVDNFFDNEMYGLADEDLYLGHVLCEKTSIKEDYEMEFTFGDRPAETRTVKTFADLVRMKILEWIEMSRNELIMSMIEGQDDDGQDEGTDGQNACEDGAQN